MFQGNHPIGDRRLYQGYVLAFDAAKPDIVFGASGHVCTNLVEFPRASWRNLEVLQGRGWEDAEPCQADALDPMSLDAALERVDTAYYLVHSMAAGRSFPELDAIGARNFAAAAARQVCEAASKD